MGNGIIYTRTKPDDFTVPPTWIPFPNNLVFRLYEIMKLWASSNEVEANISDVSDQVRFESTLKGYDIAAVRSCNEFESEWLELLEEKIMLKPVFPVGILPPVITP
ncbi:hypothetical protein IFM89_022425 [Coptis chinensis]|uniref:Uncharacterized protein n=1 Tax=Coptis chinensis TaxID=261450 RepID=A0A835I4H1_9MAGN|nr:hypothetical protein IFM89_022425 [Coptis chinensis]